MTMTSTSIDDVEVLSWGEGDEVVLLLHASATGPRALSGLAEALGHANRRVLAPAFSGYASNAQATSDGADHTARNLVIASAVLDNINARRRIVFGHSMGGLIALLSALDQAQRGQALDAVILYEPILHDVLDPGTPGDAAALQWDQEVIAKLRHAVHEGDAERGVRLFVEAWNETDWSDLPVGARKQLVAGADNLVAETTAMPGKGPRQTDLKSFNTPCLLLGGDQSPEFARLVTARAAQAIPTAREVVLPGCGHMAPVVAPHRVAEHVRAFLDGVA